ncbi:hypothetical protein MNBD_GAMMA09-140 [hydrothermal vent metagenome]|uniref:Histidine kinase domain-containing protein n=1 Tax=hydrothermal vent metagenome TaxID=652676 RepID=A0A3B0Y3U2_9ZZZZ
MMDTEDNKKIYDVMRSLAVSSSALDFDEFLRISVKNLALLYDCKYAFVAELLPGGKRAKTLTVWSGDHYARNFEYDLKGTPCEDILELNKKLIACDVCKLYPEDYLLAEMGVESYFGAPLIARDQSLLGLISVMHTAPLQPDGWAEPILSAYSVRLAVEQESKRNEEKLLTYQNQLETLVEERTRQLEAAHKDLLQQERLATLGQLIATVSHELRNPLGTIRSSVYSITEKLADKNLGVDKALARIQRNISRSDNIISELLDFTCIKEPDLKTQNFDSWMSKFLDEFQTPDNITVKTNLQSKTELEFDEHLLHRVMINLFDNACQAVAAEDNGLLTINTDVSTEHLDISITDTGIGMDTETMEHIFEPLYSTKNFGVGMGLFIVNKIIEQHHGSIEMNSKANNGTEVIIHFPLQTRH